MYNNKHHEFTTQYNHKLFAHANRWGNDVIKYITELKPKVIKFLDPNLTNVKLVRKLVPDALLIYRKWQPSQSLGNSGVEAFQLGVNFGQEVAAEEIVQQGLIDLVESYNEALGETAPAAEHRKFAQFQLGFQEGLGLAPVEPIALNFGTGNMSADLLAKYYPEVLNSYQWLGFHEYDWPTMDRLHRQGLAEGNGGMWLALRYRRIMEPIIRMIGDNWSVVITECGMTQGVLGGLDVGFSHPTNTIQGEWGNYPTPISNDDYWETLSWYSDELMKDGYVAGACMFVTAGLPPWESFETLNTITPKIKDYQRVIDSGGNMSDIFVNDVRANDDASLGQVPRIETFEKLKQIFGLDIDTTLGGDVAAPGQRFWKLVGFEVRTGVAAFLTQIKNADGSPAEKIVVFNHWPGAPELPVPVDPQYFSNAKGGFTDGSGVQGAPYSGGAVTGEDGGPYYIWPSADPLGGARVAADMASKLGWIGGTDHLTANPIFQDTLKGGATPPPGNGAELVVFDENGKEVGYFPLQDRAGAGGRIALFVDGQEQSYSPMLKR